MESALQRRIIRNPNETVKLTRGIKDLFQEVKTIIGTNVIEEQIIKHYEFLGESNSDTQLSPLEHLFFEKFFSLATERYKGANFGYQLERAGIKTTTDMKKATVSYMNYMLKKREIAIKKNGKNLKSKTSLAIDIYYS